MEVYWYISSTKVNMLKGASFKSRLREISVAIKPPWLEIGATLQPEGDLLTELRTVKHHLESEVTIREFHDLPNDESPMVFSFSGQASRMSAENAYWVALQSGNTKLLLVGSPVRAIGAAATSPYGLSPSLDPLGAVEALFRGQANKQRQGPDICSSLDYVWKEVAQASLNTGMKTPKVDGLAIYAGAVDCDKVADTKRIVLGSPIYIRQI